MWYSIVLFEAVAGALAFLKPKVDRREKGGKGQMFLRGGIFLDSSCFGVSSYVILGILMNRRVMSAHNYFFQ